MSNITKLRSKVVEIEAMRFGPMNASAIIDWVLKNGGTARYHEERTHDTNWDGHDREVTTKRDTPVPEYIAIDTLEGTMRAHVGDWVFRGLEGEFYPCKDSVKVAKYDEIDNNIINTEEPTA